MYENIKYEELKQLSDDQKKEALQELMTTYGTNSAVAQAIGGVPVAISNMYGRYVEGRKLGRKKGSKNSVNAEESKEEKLPETSVDILNNVTEIKPKRKYTKKSIEVETQQEQEPQQEIIRTPIKLAELATASFTTSLCGELTGNQIKQRVTGMINSLLDDNQYTINIQIDEK